jgi:phage FluMu gp28-like protein
MGLAILERGFKQALVHCQKSELQQEDLLKVNDEIPEEFEDFAKGVFIRSGLEMVPFIPYDYQLTLDKLIDTHRGVVITKTRQMGLTEYIACKFLHKAARFRGYLALVFSKNQKDTRNIARRIRMMANTHPKIRLAGSSLEDLSLIDGGRIVFLTSTPNAGRGFESVSDILYDECAFVDSIEEIYGAASPSQRMLGSAARTILLSTPDSQSGFY